MRRLLSQSRVQNRAFQKRAPYRPYSVWVGRFVATKFTTIGPQGTPVTSDIEVEFDDPGNTFLYLDPKIGLEFRSGIISEAQASPDPVKDPEALPLKYHSEARHFVPTSSSYPRLEMSEGLQVPSGAEISDADIVSATLHTWAEGKHAIVFDGTYDAACENVMRKSFQRLARPLEELKHL